MIIDDDKLEILVQKVLSDERERIYNSWFCEGDIVTPILEIKQSRFRKKSTVYMDLGVWENFPIGNQRTFTSLILCTQTIGIF